ncbi:MAG: hypothetical protein K2K45_05170 [Muribaculaceae bacterium]|nr:hypothetical protein [Muribaculaceae bacterium]
MKNNIEKYKKQLKDILGVFLVSAFYISGWAMYIYSEVNQANAETDRLNASTASLKDSINKANTNGTVVSRKETLIKHAVPEEIWEYIDELKATNKSLRDSVAYYAGFYELVMEHHPYEYKFSATDSGEYTKYSRSLSYMVEQRIMQKDTFIRFKKIPKLNPADPIILKDTTDSL